MLVALLLDKNKIKNVCTLGFDFEFLMTGKIEKALHVTEKKLKWQKLMFWLSHSQNLSLAWLFMNVKLLLFVISTWKDLSARAFYFLEFAKYQMT